MALITIDTLQTFEFKIPTDDVANINFYNALIKSASDIIVHYIGADFEPTPFTAHFDEIADVRYLVLKQIPVSEVSSIEVNGSPYEEDYSFDNRTGIIRFNKVLTGKNDIKVEYTAGYDEIPQDIIYACVELVQFLKKRMSNSLVGESSKTIDGGNMSLETSMPLNVLHICNRYKWKNVCV